MSAGLIHALVAVVGIGAYVVLLLTGHDGNVVLAAALAYGSGATVQAKVIPGGG